MDDEIRKIELETAKLKLQREQLAYQNELDGKQLRSDISNGIGGLFGVVLAIAEFCIMSGLLFMVGGLVGGIIWFVVSMVLFFPNTSDTLPFMYRVGASVANMQDWAVAAMFILPMLYFWIVGLSSYYRNKH